MITRTLSRIAVPVMDKDSVSGTYPAGKISGANVEEKEIAGQ